MRDAFAKPTPHSIPIWFVTPGAWPSLQDKLPPAAQAFAKALGFQAGRGKHALLPDAQGDLAHVLFGMDENDDSADPLAPGSLPTALPDGVYRFANRPAGGNEAISLATLAWLMGSYRYFDPRESRSPRSVRLVAPEEVDAERIALIAGAVTFGRDLVNRPASDLGPNALEAAALALAEKYAARSIVTRGNALLRQNFPLIHAVGRAAEEAPRLVDFQWGPETGMRVVLVGKGVCFDSGGLDIKPPNAMALMKKDMAGAAVALAAAEMIMGANLPVRLRVLLPIVENAISANSFRPGDVYKSRAGATIEIGNTDAEGRLILADALALAEEAEPDLLFNFATLTGAARVALGPDLPAFFTHDEALAAEIASCGAACADPVWRLPLWRPYDVMIDSKVATLNNVASGPFAGAIVAALFLARFVNAKRSWAHFDIYGWNPSPKPGRPEGGEVETARLVYHLVERRAEAGGAQRLERGTKPRRADIRGGQGRKKT